MRKNILFFILTICSIKFLLAYTLTILNETPESSLLEIDLHEVRITQQNEWSEISFSQAEQSTDPHSPDLPLIKLFFAIPSRGNLSAQIYPLQNRAAILEKPVLPVGNPRGDASMQSDYHLDQFKYQQTTPPVEILPQQTLNNYDVIPVIIHPIIYEYSNNTIQITEKFRLEINITGEFPRQITEYTGANNLYSGLLTNLKYGLNFTQSRAKNIYSSHFDRAHSWYKIEILQNGMYVLDYPTIQQALAMSNIDQINNLDPNTLRIFSTGGRLLDPDINSAGNPLEEIPLLILNGEGSSFTTNTKIIFYAEQRDGRGKNKPLTDRGYGEFANNPYSKPGYYWLTWWDDPASPPQRMAEVTNSSPTQTRTTGRKITHYESPSVQKMSNNSNYVWFSQQFLATGNNQVSITLTQNLEDLNNSSDLPHTIDFTMSAESSTASSNPHRLDVYINSIKVPGTSTNTYTWTGNALHRPPTPLAFTSGKAGFNQIVFTTSGTNITKYLRYYTLEWHQNLIKRNSPLHFYVHRQDTDKRVAYNLEPNGQILRIFQINNFNQANYFMNPHFIAQGNVETQFFACADADYLKPSTIIYTRPQVLDQNIVPHQAMIIYPLEFQEGAERLEKIYQNRYHLSTFTVSLEDVFNNFSGGHPDPTALRNYMQFVQINADTPKPLGAVFLGSGTVDHRNYSGLAHLKNRFMTYSYPYLTTETVTDDFFGMLFTNRNPEIILGRIPAKNSNELNLYLNKLDEYLNNTKPGWWQYTFQLIADDNNYGVSDKDFVHSSNIQVMKETIGNNIIVDQLFAHDYPLNPQKKKPHVRDLLVDKINEGRLYWVYFGHGSVRNNGDENYFGANDVPLLRNKGQYPIYITASCETGQFELVNTNSLAEELLLVKDAGSIISIGATGKSYSSGNERLFKDFLHQSINNQKIPGEAMLNAKYLTPSILGNDGYYTILGDPFLQTAYPIVSNNLILDNYAYGDSLKLRQKVTGIGRMAKIISVDKASMRVYDHGLEEKHPFGYQLMITKENPPFFVGNRSLNLSEYQVGFVLPEGIQTGKNNKIFSLAINKENNTNQTYVDRKIEINVSNTLIDINPGEKTQIQVYLDSFNFSNGDTVQPKPTVFARISSEFGINTSGASGRRMLIWVQGLNEPINVSSGFEYDLDDYTQGLLTWTLEGLKPGKNKMKLIVYDNLDEISIVETDFIVSTSVPIKIINPLVYPNPMQRNGTHFTFELTHRSHVTISIYTITGRKIKTLPVQNCNAGYNQIFWNGRDADGDNIANNTYLYIIKATAIDGKGSTETKEKLIVLR